MNEKEAKDREQVLRARLKSCDLQRERAAKDLHDHMAATKPVYDLGGGLVLCWNGSEYANEAFAVAYDPDIDEICLAGTYRSVPPPASMTPALLREQMLDMVHHYGVNARCSAQGNLDHMTKHLRKIEATIAWAIAQYKEPT